MRLPASLRSLRERLRQNLPDMEEPSSPTLQAETAGGEDERNLADLLTDQNEFAGVGVVLLLYGLLSSLMPRRSWLQRRRKGRR